MVGRFRVFLRPETGFVWWANEAGGVSAGDAGCDLKYVLRQVGPRWIPFLGIGTREDQIALGYRSISCPRLNAPHKLTNEEISCARNYQRPASD